MRDRDYSVLLEQLVSMVFGDASYSYRCYLLFPDGPARVKVKAVANIADEEKKTYVNLVFASGAGCQGQAFEEREIAYVVIPQNMDPYEWARMQGLDVEYVRCLKTAGVSCVESFPFKTKDRRFAYMIVVEATTGVTDAKLQETPILKDMINLGYELGRNIPQVKNTLPDLDKKNRRQWLQGKDRQAYRDDLI